MLAMIAPSRTNPPMAAYRFEDNRGADRGTRHLAGFGGILQVDGYSAYTSLVKARTNTRSNEAIQLAYCWAHPWTPPTLQGQKAQLANLRLRSSIWPL